MGSSKIKELAQDQQDYVVAMRREFHRSPELSGKEFHTRERLIEEIEKWVFPMKSFQEQALLRSLKAESLGRIKYCVQI